MSLIEPDASSADAAIAVWAVTPQTDWILQSKPKHGRCLKHLSASVQSHLHTGAGY